MAHLPVNHPSRPVLRVIAALIGLFILTFGVVGLIETWGLALFDRGENWVFGLRTNPAFSVLSILAGLTVAGGAIYGRNVDHFINLGGGILFLVAGLFMMALLNTGANLLNFSLTNCTVSFLIGLTLLVAGLYGKAGSREYADAEERLRHGGADRAEYDERISGQPQGNQS